MGQSPPGSLLRLREADVVRACGLLAAAQGLEIVTQQAVMNGRRSAQRLEARIVGKSSIDQVWAEASGSDPISIRWYCACRNMAEASSVPPLACEHVAAMLTAWIRDPSSFDSLSTGSGSAPTATPGDDFRTTSSRAASEAGSPRVPHGPDPIPYSPSNRSLAEELARLSAADLLSISRRVLAEVESPQDARQARTLLEETLCTPSKLAALIGRLDQNAQLLLAELLILEGRTTSADLDAMAARAEQARGTMRIAIGVLERHALVFPAPGLSSPVAPAERGVHPWRQVAGWRIPREIRSTWSAPLPIPAAPVLSPKGPPVLEEMEPAASEHQRPVRQTARVTRATLRQLYLACSLLAYAPARFNPSPPVGGVPFSTSAPNPLPGPPQRGKQATLLPPFPLVPGDLSAQAAGDFARGAGIPLGLAQLARRVIVLGREQEIAHRLQDLLHLPTEEQSLVLKRAFVTWCRTELPMELADLALSGSPVRGRFDQRQETLRPAALAAEVVGGRRFLLSVLRRAEPGIWYSLRSLLDLIWRLNPFFLRGRQNTFKTPAWWLERSDQPRPLRAGLREEWLQAEGNYIRAWLCGPLHWWGVLDLATDGSGVPVAVRLTTLGAHLLEEDVRPGVENRGPILDYEHRAGLTFTPRDTEVAVVVTRQRRLAVSPIAAGASLLDALTNWARPVGIAGGRVIYAFDPQLAADAFDQGKTGDALLSLLEADLTAAGRRALAVVEAQLAEWHVAYGRTSITSGWTLLEARDEATLCEALAHLPDTAALVRRLSLTHALVAPELSGALETELRKLGFPAPK